MAYVTQSFTVDIACTRALSAAERQALADAIAQVLGVNIDRVEPAPGGLLTVAIGAVRPVEGQ